MHIVIDGKIYGLQGWGGINTYFNELLPRLTQLDGVQVSLLVPSEASGPLPGGAVKRRARGFFSPGASVGPGRRHGFQPLVRGMSRWLASRPGSYWKEPHIFHSTYFTRSTSPSAIQVATAYDLNHELFPQMYQSPWGRWLRQQYRTYLEEAHRIIAISQKTKRDILRFYRVAESQVDVIPLAVNQLEFFPEDKPLEGGLEKSYFLYVGGRRHYKNFPFLLRAFSQARLPEEVSLLVVGTNWSEQECRTLDELKLRRKVRLLGEVSIPALRKLYSGAMAFVYPSLHEGFGLPILEAMACGAPVIAADTEIFREVGGERPIYFNPLDETSLRQALELVSGQARKADSPEQGYLWVREFSWDRCAQQTQETYRRAMGRGLS